MTARLKRFWRALVGKEDQSEAEQVMALLKENTGRARQERQKLESVIRVADSILSRRGRDEADYSQ